MQRFNEELEKRFGVHRTAEYRETRFSDTIIEMAKHAISHNDLSELQYRIECSDYDEDFRVDWKRVSKTLKQIRQDLGYAFWRK